MWLACSAARAHCSLLFNLPSTTSFLQSWFLPSWHPACAGAWDYSSLDTGFCTSLCWTLWGFCQSTSPARGGPPECPPFRPMCLQIQCQILSLLNVHVTALSWSLIQMLNGLGRSISSWGVPLKTTYQLDLELLISTPYGQQSRQFSTYVIVYPASP